MPTYTEKELDERIHKFLAKRTQFFPELQDETIYLKMKKTQNRSANPLEKVSIFWSTYIHA